MGQNHEPANVVNRFPQHLDGLQAVAVTGDVAGETHCDDVTQGGVHFVRADQNDVLFVGEFVEFILRPTIMLGDHRSGEAQTFDLGYHLFGCQSAVGAALVCVHVEVK